MEKSIINIVWKGLVLLAVSLAIINAYLEWFGDRGNQLILIITLLVIIAAIAIRFAIQDQSVKK